MNFRLSFIPIILVAYLAASCEKVIRVDLDNAAPRIVIEGVVTNQPGTSAILVSQTKSFDDANDFAGLSGAIVHITDDEGNVTPFTETAAGIYAAPGFTGVPGKAYTMNVQVNGQSFTATSAMPQPVPVDTIYVKNDNLFGDTRPIVQAQITDPPGKGNHYRFIQFVNGIKEKEIFTRNDDLIDGNVYTISLRYEDDGNDNKLKPGDQVKVDLLCIDKAVYKFWYSVETSALGDNWATPANPVTNISGGALGYFSAHTLESKTMVVP